MKVEDIDKLKEKYKVLVRLSYEFSNSRNDINHHKSQWMTSIFSIEFFTEKVVSFLTKLCSLVGRESDQIRV